MIDNKKIKEKTFYCYEAKLKYINKDKYFLVPFNVLATDGYEAQKILEIWLSNPSQTGYKYEMCVGIIPKPSNQIIMMD